MPQKKENVKQNKVCNPDTEGVKPSKKTKRRKS